jgi:hypothetical protein
VLEDKVQNDLQENLGEIKCESGNVEVQWDNIKKNVLDSWVDLERNSSITQEIISK